MDNLKLYEKVRAVPDNAKKKITGGRLSGKTDINPMWRIKTLTENFGMCGIGWYINTKRLWLEHGADNVIAAFCEIELYIKHDDNWSKPIIGLGGSEFISKEKNGLYTSDECFKMAYTDAISVCCKLLGIGADVYWEQDRTKYDGKVTEIIENADNKVQENTIVNICENCNGNITQTKNATVEQIIAGTLQTYRRKLCYECAGKARKGEI